MAYIAQYIAYGLVYSIVHSIIYKYTYVSIKGSVPTTERSMRLPV